mmetsp:Transcript_5378/g.12302  ORF Transcript_5378/g.12302 Transcript_5378/m.12302 type:complete len:306 (-) Transcript_5378:376-1293(-)
MLPNYSARVITFLLLFPRGSEPAKGTLLWCSARRKTVELLLLLLLWWWLHVPLHRCVLLHVLLLLLLLLLLLRVHVRVAVVPTAGRCRLNALRRRWMGRHAKEIVVGRRRRHRRLRSRRVVVVVEIQQRRGTAAAVAGMSRGGRSRRPKEVVDRSRGRRRCVGRTGRLGGGRGRDRRGAVEILVVVVLVVVVVLHADPGDLHDDPVLPGGDRLAFLDDVHPHRHGGLVPVGPGDQRRLEPEVVLAGQREGVPDLSKGRRRPRVAGLGGQKDVRLRLEVAVFRNKVSNRGHCGLLLVSVELLVSGG